MLHHAPYLSVLAFSTTVLNLLGNFEFVEQRESTLNTNKVSTNFMKISNYCEVRNCVTTYAEQNMKTLLMLIRHKRINLRPCYYV